MPEGKGARVSQTGQSSHRAGRQRRPLGPLPEKGLGSPAWGACLRTLVADNVGLRLFGPLPRQAGTLPPCSAQPTAPIPSPPPRGQLGVWLNAVAALELQEATSL